MNEHDMTEQAYKNGYEKGYEDGKRDAVKHGRWITDQVEAFNPLTGDTYPLDVLQCSLCGEYFDVSEARNYCPNCGARMDGEEDG